MDKGCLHWMTFCLCLNNKERKKEGRKEDRQTGLWVEFSSEPPNRPNNDSSLGMGFERAHVSFYPLLWLPGCQFSLWLWTVAFPGYLRVKEEGLRIGYIKTPQILMFSLKFSCFLWIRAPWVATSLQLISRALKKLIATIFVSFIQLLKSCYFASFVDVSFSDFKIFNKCCNPGIKATWLRFVILLTRFWLNVMLLSIFVFIFLRNYGL